MPRVFSDSKKRDERFFWLKIFLVVIIAFGAMIFSFLFIDKESAKHRDAARLDGLRALREALFQYYNENGYYPSSVSDWNPEKADYGAGTRAGAGDYDNLSSLISGFLPELPKDPLNPLNSPAINDFYLYRYVASPDGRNFALIYETENHSDDSPQTLRGW